MFDTVTLKPDTAVVLAVPVDEIVAWQLVEEGSPDKCSPVRLFHGCEPQLCLLLEEKGVNRVRIPSLDSGYTRFLSTGKRPVLFAFVLSNLAGGCLSLSDIPVHFIVRQSGSIRSILRPGCIGCEPFQKLLFFRLRQSDIKRHLPGGGFLEKRAFFWLVGKESRTLLAADQG